MPGIFSPELPDVGDGGGTPSVSSGAGLSGATAALEGGARAIDAFFGGRTATASSPTQKEKDNEALKPLTRQLRKIEEMKGSGTPGRYNVLIKTALSNFVTENPVLTDEAYKVAEAITGKTAEVLNPQDPGDIVTTGLQEFMKTDQGELAILTNAVWNKDGSMNAQATNAAIQEAYYNDLQTKAKAEKLKIMAESSSSLLTFAKNQAQINLPLFAASQQQRTQSAVSNLITGGLINANPQDPIDIAKTAGYLRSLKAKLKTQFETEATQSGYANLSDYDVSQALAPIDNMLTILTSSTNALDDVIKTNEALDAASSVILGQALGATVGAPIGYLKAVQEQFGAALATQNLDKITKFAFSLSENGSLMGMEDLFHTNIGIVPTIDTEGNPSDTTLVSPIRPEAIEKAKTLNPEEKKQVVKNGLTRFKFLDNPTSLGKQGVREAAVHGLAESLSVLQSGEFTLSEDSISQMFDESFFRTYDLITKYDDKASSALQLSVGSFVKTDIQRRINSIETSLKSRNYGSVRLDMNSNGVFTFTIGPNFKNSRNPGDIQLREFMQRNGVPLTNEGFATLFRTDTKDKFPVSPRVTVLQDFVQDTGADSIAAEIRKLNKMLYISRRLGTVGQVVERSVKDDFSSRPVVVYSKEEYQNLPDGTPYRLVDEETGESWDAIK